MTKFEKKFLRILLSYKAKFIHSAIHRVTENSSETLSLSSCNPILWRSPLFSHPHCRLLLSFLERERELNCIFFNFSNSRKSAIGLGSSQRDMEILSPVNVHCNCRRLNIFQQNILNQKILKL